MKLERKNYKGKPEPLRRGSGEGGVPWIRSAWRSEEKDGDKWPS